MHGRVRASRSFLVPSRMCENSADSAPLWPTCFEVAVGVLQYIRLSDGQTLKRLRAFMVPVVHATPLCGCRLGWGRPVQFMIAMSMRDEHPAPCRPRLVHLRFTHALDVLPRMSRAGRGCARSSSHPNPRCSFARSDWNYCTRWTVLLRGFVSYVRPFHDCLSVRYVAAVPRSPSPARLPPYLQTTNITAINQTSNRSIPLSFFHLRVWHTTFDCGLRKFSSSNSDCACMQAPNQPSFASFYSY
ncbi:hypothetical protein PENSPDRAFT_369156 [Peniophora sp. CONT]|nr:hypothetical protein PENSPDRAFT_369156 [Peniophora sp. CONT]